MSQVSWHARLTQVVAGEIRRYRKERGMSAQQLADRCAQLGLSLPQPVLSNLENGRRESVSIAELLVLAEALEVPPILLVIPVARQQTVEILPGMDAPTWEAAAWWRGEGTAMMTVPGEGPVVIRDPSRKNPADFVLAHQDLVARWEITERAAADAAEVARRSPSGEERDRWEATADVHRQNAVTLQKELGERRAAMRAQDLIPPPLPPGLDWIDEPVEGVPHT